VGEYGEVLVTGWEQARIIRQENVGTMEADIRADIAGLGDLLYHILTLIPAIPGDKKPVGTPDKSWKFPKELWNLTKKIRANRGATIYPRVKQLQMEVEDFRDELGPRGGRATAFDMLKQQVQKWQ
jgi:hypothetical protein